jgi:hypothetical protein
VFRVDRAAGVTKEVDREDKTRAKDEPIRAGDAKKVQRRLLLQ